MLSAYSAVLLENCKGLRKDDDNGNPIVAYAIVEGDNDDDDDDDDDSTYDYAPAA
ncbi:hypothetical protein BVRB_8g195350 [Beta vulgaris subsp. vulgaris]|nr:hypothetical protein BVRB_8g195350 [Beta vulgaris subsp. vulgaris]